MVWQHVAVDDQENESVSRLEEGKFYTRGNVNALNAFLAQITGKDNPKVKASSHCNYNNIVNRQKFSYS